MPQLIKANPNTALSLTTGGLAVLVVVVLGLVGVVIDPIVAAAIAAALTSFCLLIGREGIKGLLRTIYYGKNGKPAAPPANPSNLSS